MLKPALPPGLSLVFLRDRVPYSGYWRAVTLALKSAPEQAGSGFQAAGNCAPLDWKGGPPQADYGLPEQGREPAYSPVPLPMAAGCCFRRYAGCCCPEEQLQAGEDYYLPVVH